LYNPKSESESLGIYRKLVLIRKTQEAIIREYPKDQIKTPVHLGIGLEGISVGIVHCLPKASKWFGQLRNHGQYLAITGDTDKFFSELYGKATGMGGGKAGSMHLASPSDGLMSNSGIVGSTISLAVGSGFAAKYQGNEAITVAMFGDSAFEEGEFWESLNFACLHSLRVIFVCEDNNIAVHTAGKERRGFKSFGEAVNGFNCHVLEGAGTDVRSVIDIGKKSIELINKSPKPVFLCLNWFRVLEHVGPHSDFDIGYRMKPSEEDLSNLDPVKNFELFLIASGIDPVRMQTICEEVECQIENSISYAMSAPYPSEEDLYKGVFA